MKEDYIFNKINAYLNKYNNYLHSREASFDFCYNYFISFEKCAGDILSKKNKQQSCLQLGFYLASFGMFRNSDLLEKSYKYYESVLAVIIQHKLWQVDVNSFNNPKIITELKNVYDSLKDVFSHQYPMTINTKCLLGIYSCIPAFDSNVKYFFNRIKKTRYEFSVDCFDGRLIKFIYKFYSTFKKQIHFATERLYIKDYSTGNNLRNYNIARVIDLLSWIEGLPIVNIETSKLTRNKKNVKLKPIINEINHNYAEIINSSL